MGVIRWPSAAAVALLLCSAQLSARVRGDYVISSTSTANVPSKSQLSANQLFAKQWQVKGDSKIKNAKLDGLWMLIPGRVFVSFDDDRLSELVVEITVSGSSAAAVEIINISNDETNSEPNQNIGERLSLNTKENKQIETGAYLLTEVRVKHKRALKDVLATRGEVVVEDNVLFTMSKENFDVASSKSRRMTEMANANTTATSSGLIVEEVKLESETTRREWLVRASGGVVDDSITIDLSLLVPGNATMYRMETRYCDDCIGHVTARE